MAKSTKRSATSGARGTAGTPKRRARAKADWAPEFLTAFEELGLVTQAARRADVGRSTVYRRRDDDEAFAAQWQEIEHDVTERMEQEAKRRAVEGVESHKYDKDGNLLWTETKYSDTLLIFLLKARRPETYRDNVRHEHSGLDGRPLEHVVNLAADPAAAKLAHELLAKASVQPRD